MYVLFVRKDVEADVSSDGSITILSLLYIGVYNDVYV